MFFLINVVVNIVCLHCTLQPSLVQIIFYLRMLLFILIYFIFSCMTCMKMIRHDCKKHLVKKCVVKMEINVILNACHSNY